MVSKVTLEDFVTLFLTMSDRVSGWLLPFLPLIDPLIREIATRPLLRTDDNFLEPFRFNEILYECWPATAYGRTLAISKPQL